MLILCVYYIQIFFSIFFPRQRQAHCQFVLARILLHSKPKRRSYNLERQRLDSVSNVIQAFSGRLSHFLQCFVDQNR